MTAPLLATSGVSAWYGSAQVLFEVDLSLERGRSSGCSAGTGPGRPARCARSWSRIRRHGQVMIEGRDVSRSSVEQMARHGVAWVPDDRRIFGGSASGRTLSWRRWRPVPPRGPGQRAMRGLSHAGRVARQARQRAERGEQQLVAVARALVARPLVLLLDEPTEGLAPLIVEEMVRAIGRLPGEFGVGILLVEENAEVAEALCRRVAVLQLGQISYSGGAAEFFGDARSGIPCSPCRRMASSAAIPPDPTPQEQAQPCYRRARTPVLAKGTGKPRQETVAQSQEVRKSQ